MLVPEKNPHGKPREVVPMFTARWNCSLSRSAKWEHPVISTKTTRDKWGDNCQQKCSRRGRVAFARQPIQIFDDINGSVRLQSGPYLCEHARSPSRSRKFCRAPPPALHSSASLTSQSDGGPGPKAIKPNFSSHGRAASPLAASFAICFSH